MRQVISVPTSFSSSAASRVPLRLAGMKARTPMSTVRPPLMTPVTVPTTASFLREGFFKRGPVAGLRYLESRELVVALFVAALDRDEDFVARLHAFGIVRESGARQNAFGLVADVDENLFGGEGDDGALDLLRAGCGLVGVAVLELGQDVGKVFLRFGGLFGGRFGLEPTVARQWRFSAAGAGLAIPRRCALLAGGFGRFGGGLGLGNAFVAHDVYCSIVPCHSRERSKPARITR